MSTRSDELEEGKATSIYLSGILVMFTKFYTLEKYLLCVLIPFYSMPKN